MANFAGCFLLAAALCVLLPTFQAQILPGVCPLLTCTCILAPEISPIFLWHHGSNMSCKQ